MNSENRGYSAKVSANKRKLGIKEHMLKLKAHRKPARASVCLLGVVALLVVLSGISSLRLSNAKRSIAVQQAPYLTGDEIVFTAAFVGDVMLGRGIQSAARFYGYDEYFKYTKGFFGGFDVVLCNFENPITDEEWQYSYIGKEILLSATKQCLPALKAAGFTMIGLANNHMMDYGLQAVEQTVQALEEAGLSYAGVGLRDNGDLLYVIQEYDGLKVATLAISEALTAKANSQIGSEESILTHRSTRSYLNAVSRAKEEADLVVVLAHWGNEYTSIVTDKQREMAENLIDAGADIIIGSHPHAIQPVEIYNGKIIFYSLGNFITDQAWSRTKDSVLIRMYLDASGNCLCEAVPLRINNAIPSETGNPIFVSRIFHDLAKRVDSSYYVIKDNRLYFSLPGFLS